MWHMFWNVRQEEEGGRRRNRRTKLNGFQMDSRWKERAGLSWPPAHRPIVASNPIAAHQPRAFRDFILYSQHFSYRSQGHRRHSIAAGILVIGILDIGVGAFGSLTSAIGGTVAGACTRTLTFTCDMRLDMCLDVCLDMCIDMCTDKCVGIGWRDGCWVELCCHTYSRCRHTHMSTQVATAHYTPVYTHVSTHMSPHTCLQTCVYPHMSTHVSTHTCLPTRVYTHVQR